MYQVDHIRIKHHITEYHTIYIHTYSDVWIYIYIYTHIDACSK